MYSSEIARELNFDSATNYQYVHFTNIDRDYREIMKDVVNEWERFSSFGIRYYPHVSIGWDNNPRFNPFRHGIIKNNTPEEFEKALISAKEHADRHGVRLITVNSWNEWTEMSYLLPDDINGTGYLDAIKKVFGGKNR